VIPKAQTTGAIGLDLHANEEIIVEKGQRKLVSTGIAMEVPRGHYPRIAPRSGLSLKGIDIGAGVIDPDYRGEVKALVVNNGETDYKISKQDRIAQVVVEKAVVPKIEEVKELGKIERDEKGFGSTNNVQLMNNINKNKSPQDLFSVFLKKGLKMLTIDGDIGGNKINALVDSGAGDNYVSLEVAQHLRKYQRARKEVTVRLADGKEYKITKKLANVPISFKG
jgi:dUTP pyrophosphatase